MERRRNNLDRHGFNQRQRLQRKTNRQIIKNNQNNLYANYYRANLDEVVHEAVYLTDAEQTNLTKLMKIYENIFDGNLGTWKGKPYY